MIKLWKNGKKPMREMKTYKDRLRTYISEDEVYQKYKKGETNFNDFDKFCIQHCADIEEMLQDNQSLKIQVSAREEEYNKLKAENERLSEQLTMVISKLDKYDLLEK